MKHSLFSCILIGFTGFAFADQSVDQEEGSIELPDGYSLELVLSAPTISDPVAMAWDGNGVLYLVEMRPALEGDTKQRSVVSRHEDTNGDGAYDKSTTFIDEKFSPRQVLPLDDRILVTGADSLDLYVYRDTDGDGVADEKERVFRGGKVEVPHRDLAGQLVWGIDNWVYSNRVSDRFRFWNGNVTGESLPHKVVLAGMSMDHEGRFFCIDRKGGLPTSFQQDLEYGSVNLTEQYGEGIDSVAGVTGYASPEFFRGDRLPEMVQGNLFLPRPEDQLFRSLSVTRDNGLSVLSDSFSKQGFLTAVASNLYPVGSATAPDGRLYLLDRNRSGKSESESSSSGNFLTRLFTSGEEKESSRTGRIYRLVHESHESDVTPRMLDQTTAELVAHLSHPNGWWRDMAQRIIILREDRQTIFPQLEKVLREGDEPIARLHALWTIDGLGRASYEMLAATLRDPDPRVQAAAVRISELFIKGRDPIVGVSVRAISKEAEADLARQIVVSIRSTGTDDRLLLGVEKELFEKFAENPVMAAIGGSYEDNDSEPSEKPVAIESPGERLAPFDSWKFDASHNANTVRRAFDGKRGTRYATGGSQRSGMWIQVEFPEAIAVRQLVLDSGTSENDFPRAYEVLVSSDGNEWSEPIASGKGSHPETVIAFPETETRFLRVALTEGAPRCFWSVHEFAIYGKPVSKP